MSEGQVCNSPQIEQPVSNLFLTRPKTAYHIQTLQTKKRDLTFIIIFEHRKINLSIR